MVPFMKVKRSENTNGKVAHAWRDAIELVDTEANNSYEQLNAIFTSMKIW